MDNTVKPIKSITSKNVYCSLSTKITEEPSAKLKMENRCGEGLWKSACVNIYVTSIDVCS